jgi:hypothetical protein
MALGWTEILFLETEGEIVVIGWGLFVFSGGIRFRSDERVRVRKTIQAEDMRYISKLVRAKFHNSNLHKARTGSPEHTRN